MKINYKSKLYEIIDTINMNNRLYHVIYNGTDIDYLQEINGKYVIPNKDLSLDANRGKSFTHLNEQTVLNEVMGQLRDDIGSSKLDGKEKVIDAVKTLKTSFKEDSHLNSLINGNLEIFNSETFKKHVEELLNYTDEIYRNSTELKLDSITTFEIDGQKFIKKITENGEVKVLEDLVENPDLETQLNKTQNELSLEDMEDGLKGADEVFDYMEKFEKVETPLDTLTNLSSPKPVNQDLESVFGLEAATNYQNTLGATELIGNLDSNFYINPSTDEVLSPEVDYETGKVTLTNLDEKNANNKVKPKETTTIQIEDAEISDVMLETLLTEKKDTLTSEQIDHLNNLKAQRSIEREEIVEMDLSNTKKLLLVPNKKEAAYIDIIVMAIITEIIAFVALFIVLLMK